MKEKYPRNCQVRVSPAWHLTKLSLTGPIQSQNKSKFIEDSSGASTRMILSGGCKVHCQGLFVLRRALNIDDGDFEEVLNVEDDALQVLW